MIYVEIFPNQDDVESLKECLQNAEDKLTAAEQCKKMLNEDVLNLKQDVDELTKELKVNNIIIIVSFIGKPMQECYSIDHGSLCNDGGGCGFPQWSPRQAMGA